MPKDSKPKEPIPFVEVDHINGYLIPGPDIYVMKRNKSFFNVPEIGIGNKPIDDGNYLFTPEEMTDFIKREPRSEKYFRPWYGAAEFIQGKKRFCLLLKDCPPEELRKMPLVYERVKNVREFRLRSKSAGTRKIADKPTRFHVENFPTGNYLLIPKVSGSSRRYIPIGFMTPNELASDLVFIVPNADLFHFGVLTSSVHMNWTRLVCGRLGISYRYSATICYNPFPWPLFYPESQRRRIEQTAQKILDARANYPNATYADLYDEVSMPYDLRRAHEENDREVMKAYYFPPEMNELEMQIRLLEMYQTLHEEYDEVIED